MHLYRFEIEVLDVFSDELGALLPDRKAALERAAEIAATHVHEAEQVADSRIVRVNIIDDSGKPVEVVEVVAATMPRAV